MIKQGFQFLNTLSSCLRQKVMRFLGHAYEVFRAVIASNTIKVVNYPAIGKQFAINLFPYKDVFSNISFLTSTRMKRLTKPNITFNANGSTTLPHWVFFRRACFQILYHTSLAHLCCFVHFPATLRAYFRIMLRVIQAVYSSSFSSFITSIIPSYRIKPALFSANWAKLLDRISPLKILSAIFTFEIYHHSYNFTINQHRSQVYLG